MTKDDLQDRQTLSSVRLARAKKLLYSMEKTAITCDDLSEDRLVQNWNIFQSLSNNCGLKMTETLHAVQLSRPKPTFYNPVSTTLVRANEVSDALGQEHAHIFVI